MTADRSDEDLGQEQEFESLLDYLRTNRGFDFTGYKRASLRRRIDKRCREVGMAKYSAYQDYLEVHPDEFVTLFNTILINVTEFFRDPPAWESLRQHLIPRLREKDEGIRVWVAGCASGEEAYSVAMLIAEGLGEETFQRRVKIYATDVDDDALEAARTGSYTPKQLQHVSEELRGRYFESTNGQFTFRKALRRSLIFGRNDLVQDAPISRLDLLVCRNTLMYFTAEMQARILTHFHFALNDQGMLFLGKSETMLTGSELFHPLNTKHRIFSRGASPAPAGRTLTRAGATQAQPGTSTSVLLGKAFESTPVAQIMIDVDGTLGAFNREAGRMFGLDPRDVGRRFQDLELSYRPLELRSRMEEALAERRPIAARNVERAAADGSTQHLDVVVAPVADDFGNHIGVAISFTDVSRYHQLQRDLVRSNQELETAYEELQSTNEELETTNEELQSTVEELETTNEELQSTNEELETMNEELQSTNEELETINVELSQRTEEVNRVNFFMEAIMKSLRSAVVVTDQRARVSVWNGRAEDLWGLRAEEVVGQSVFALDIGFPVEELRAPLRAALDGGSYRELTVPATTRRGKRIQCHVMVTPLKDSGEVEGVVVLMEEAT